MMPFSSPNKKPNYAEQKNLERLRELENEHDERIRREERNKITKDLQKRAKSLYCTADDFGYHDKNCEGLGCEKDTLKYIIKLIK